MARVIRKANLVSQQSTKVTYAVQTTTGTEAVAGEIAVQPPAIGARIVKWWIKNQTVGAGTTTATAFLVVSGGTSSTRQISDSIAIDIDATVPTYQEAFGMNAPYEIAAADMSKALAIVFTNDTTVDTTALAGLSYGVVWAL